MRQTNKIDKELSINGFLVRDGFLPQRLFEQLKDRVLRAWAEPCIWNTRVKGPGKPIFLPRQGPEELARISVLLASQKQKLPKVFTYLYHSLHKNTEQNALVDEISSYLRSGWSDEINHLGIVTSSTQFSLTAFTPYCYLDRHTDFSPTEDKAYKVSLILYFQCPPEFSILGGLKFDYHGKYCFIEAIENRSVLFVPSNQTIHSIQQFPIGKLSNAEPRLAVSGWLI